MQWNDEAKQVVIDVLEGNISRHRAALMLGVSTRTIERKKSQYSSRGEVCFVHGNSGRTPSNSIDMESVDKLITGSAMEGANFCEISRLLKEYCDVSVSDSTLRRYYLNNGILSPKCRKRTRRKLRKRLRELKKSSELSQSSAETLNALEHEKITGCWKHPTKPRSAMFGQRLEMDASSFVWIKGLGKMTLHACIDDATGHLLGLWLEQEETLHGYYKVLEQILSTHGIPFELRTDRRTVFTYKRKGEGNPEADSMTQFAFACSKLGIELECNSDPDFKPKIERANQTLQGILPFRFGMEKITTVEEANTYLQQQFIPFFNNEFGYGYDIIRGKRRKIPSAFIKCSEEQIRTTLVVLSERVVNNGTTIKVDNQYMELHDHRDKRIALAPGTCVTLSRVLDGFLYAISPKGQWYTLHAVPTRYEHAPDQIVTPEPKPIQKPNKPKPGHPWSYEQQKLFRKNSELMKSLEPLYTSKQQKSYA